jgi:hypothetical protein
MSVLDLKTTGGKSWMLVTCHWIDWTGIQDRRALYQNFCMVGGDGAKAVDEWKLFQIDSSY